MMHRKYIGGEVQTKSRTVPISHVAKHKTESPKKQIAEWPPKPINPGGPKKSVQNSHGIPANPTPGRVY